MNARALLSFSLALLALSGCPSRPASDAGLDVILAPIDVPAADAADSAIAADSAPADVTVASDGASVSDGGGLDAAPLSDAGDASAARDARGPRCDPEAGLGEAGCVVCPTTSSGLLNQCTASACARFDNARCGRLLPDGGLPSLP
jgi:hypothetical protein